jgi:CheY-like chemotaxis protein
VSSFSIREPEVLVAEEYKADILIVDDVVANLRVLEGLLSGEGYKCRVARNGVTAIRAAESKPPDLIMLDITMPEMDGYEVCRRLQEIESVRRVPIIFVSALDNTTDKVKAFEAGGVDYVTKPFQAEEVLARVGTHVEMTRLQRTLAFSNAELEARVDERTRQMTEQVDLFRKFVPPTFMKALEDGETFDVVEGIAREERFTVLCCDIRRFTNFSDSISCTNVYRFLNSYFAVMEPGVREYGGFVYQYVGDEIMALFDLIDDAFSDSGVRAALAFQKRILPKYNDGRARAGYEPIEVGVGVNTGPVAIGIAGTPHRMDACAFGGSVNLAARCQSLTKEFKAPIIITQDTYDHLQDQSKYEVKALGDIEIRRMEDKVPLYEVLDGEI